MNVDYLQKLIYTLKGEQKDEKNNFQIQICKEMNLKKEESQKRFLNKCEENSVLRK